MLNATNMLITLRTYDFTHDSIGGKPIACICHSNSVRSSVCHTRARCFVHVSKWCRPTYRRNSFTVLYRLIILVFYHQGLLRKSDGFTPNWGQGIIRATNRLMSVMSFFSAAVRTNWWTGPGTCISSMYKLLSLSFGHDAWGPELETSRDPGAAPRDQEMFYLSAAVQGNHLSAAGTSIYSTRAVRHAVVAYHQRWTDQKDSHGQLMLTLHWSDKSGKS